MFEQFTIPIAAFITIFALGLLTISLLSYRKYNNKKLLFTSVVFILFIIKGIVLSAQAFQVQSSVITAVDNIGLLELVILVFLFIATLKR